MKRFVITVLLGVGFCTVALAAPQQIYSNPGIVTSVPTIDAIIFYNSGIFELNTTTSITNTGVNNTVGAIVTSFPFSTSDTLYFTNTTSGTMSDIPGFLFETATNGTTHSASSFDNDGVIIGYDYPAAPVIYVVAGGTGTTALVNESLPVSSQVEVLATNILNDGTISVGNYGLLQMVGNNINNENGALVAGAINTGGLSFDPIDTTGGNDLFYSGYNYYVNPPGVYDLFWGVTNGGTLQLSQGQLLPPDTTAVNVGGREGVTDLGLALPLNFNPKFASYVYAYAYDASNTYFNIVFVNENFTDVNGQTDPNITATVAYSSDYEILTSQVGDLNAEMAMVQFALTAPDVVTGQVVTNAIYLLDAGAALSPMVDYDNAGSANGYSRPNAFAITTTTPFSWLDAEPANFPYSSGLIYAAGTYMANSVTYEAAEYGAQIGRNPGIVSGSFNFDNIAGDFAALLTLPDPTNEPARIELTADQLDLSTARMRAEGMVTINATNFVGGLAGSDWGEINSRLGAANGSLVISNFYPASFQRLRGGIYAWSGTWENIVTNGAAFGIFNTNTFHYHLLIVDQNLGGNFQSAIRNLDLTGANSIDVQDSLYVINQATFNTRYLTISSNAVFTQNASSLYGTNMPGLNYLWINTNGVLTVENVLDLGLDQTKNQISPVNRQYSIESIENRGQIDALTLLFQSYLFGNDGVITTSSGGSMEIEAQTLNMGLVLTNQGNYMYVSGNLLLSAENIGVTNSTIITGYASTGGSLTLQTSSAGQISDGVPSAPTTSNVLNNFWQVTDGFNLPVEPASGDLFGTQITTIATNTTLAKNIWAGRGDYTNVVDGFTNNVVIGRLTLSWQSPHATNRFSGAGTNNGMYVDYLEFDTSSNSLYGPGTGYSYKGGLVIDTNLTIYFADCNFPIEKVTAAYPGRLVWVSNFWGPNSTVLVTNGSDTNQVCLVSDAVVKSQDPRWPGDNNPYPLNPGGAWYYGPSNECPAVTITYEPPPKSLAVSLAAYTNQSFALAKGTYNGLFYDTNQISSTNSGFFTFTLSGNGAFSGKLLMGPSNYTFSGSGTNKFNISSGAATVTAKHGRQSLIVNLQLMDTADVTDQVTGSVSNDTWVAQLEGDLKPVWSAKRTSPYSANGGRYTMVFTNGGTNNGPDGCTNGPDGYSYGCLAVSKLGVLSVAGKLADGNAFSQSVPIGEVGLQGGRWPFYAYVAGGGDFLLGWIDFQLSDVNAASISQTNIFWSKAPSSKARYYPCGFSNTNFNLAGAPYSIPGRDSSGLSLTDPVVILSGDGLVSAVTNLVEYNGKLKYSTNNLTLSINPTAGSFAGRFSLAEDSPFMKMDGVVLTNLDGGGAFGFFLGTDGESGAVRLQSSP
jgi:hypothetical protein